MAKVYFKRKTTQEIEELPVEDGSLIYNTDNGKTYMDFGDDRIQTGGNADTMIAIGGDEAPTDTDIKLWFPNDVVNTKASEVVNSMDGDETDLAPSVHAVKNYIDGTLLWKNNNPTQDFGAQTITLSSDDYDELEWFFLYTKENQTAGTSVFVKKGYAPFVTFASVNASTNIARRLVDYTNDTTYSARNAWSGTNENSGYCIPAYVIGYKRKSLEEVS